ncbi:MAG: serine/threonine protein kinase [Burkholderiales bacterium]|nr:serine/threonine protein kinase [Burkholderiales bacterium]
MSSQANRPLPEGFQLENYRILRVLASGGFSFVYLAHDEREAPVALKEYLPAALALRTGDAAAPVVPEEHAALFRRGMKRFFEEGRALAGLHHPNVVRVLNFFRANGTAYMAMRYERGRTLEEHIRRRRGPLAEDWLRTTFGALLRGLREVHARGLLHLDIKPANVYLRNDGEPLLIDFGAARRALATEAAALAPVHTPGFASPEHQAAGADCGPWSDIYSVGATLYACLAGAPPLAAAERLASDRLVPARRAWSGRYSADLLDTVDWCLRLDPRERPQSVLELQKVLDGERAPAHRGEAPVLERLRDAIVRFAKR